MEMMLPKVISMYSFKGGAGRTVTTANLTPYIAKRLSVSPSNPLLLMDFDLDSAGLTMMLDLQNKFQDSRFGCAQIMRGLVDLGFSGDEQELFDTGMADVSHLFGFPDGSIRFLGTEIISSYEMGINIEDVGKIMEYLMYLCSQNGIRTILIDSAAGRQDTAQLCHKISNMIICCCRLSKQFLEGTTLHLTRFIQDCNDGKHPTPALGLLPLAVPSRNTNADVEMYKIRKAELGLLRTNLYNSPAKPNVKLLPEIGEIHSFKFLESILIPGSNLEADEQRAIESYMQVAEEIVQLLERCPDAY